MDFRTHHSAEHNSTTTHFNAVQRFAPPPPDHDRHRHRRHLPHAAVPHGDGRQQKVLEHGRTVHKERGDPLLAVVSTPVHHQHAAGTPVSIPDTVEFTSGYGGMVPPHRLVRPRPGQVPDGTAQAQAPTQAEAHFIPLALLAGRDQG